MSIEYSGKQNFSRARKLSEIEGFEHYKDKVQFDAFSTIDERDQFTDELFTKLAKTYLKGEVVKEGLSRMDPAQFIPIEEGADPVRAAAIRIARETSENGTIITYTMFQKAVDVVLNKKWELRGTVINTQIPASTYERTSQATARLSNSSDTIDSWIKEFINQNGIITTILGVLTMSPFQASIFQALGVEKGAQGVQLSQIPIGITIFLELGIKAERILAMLKGSKLSTPAVENLVNDLSLSETKRAEAFSSIGIDYEQFKKSQEVQDCEILINYVKEYYARYGGLDKPGGFLTIDHWVAYLQVAQNQQIVRGALNTSSSFSPKFQAIRDLNTSSTEFPQGQTLFDDTRNRTSKMFIEFGSSIKALNQNSDALYDNIVNVMSFGLNDAALCCLVQIFGQIIDPGILIAVAALLRLLGTGIAVDLNGVFNFLAKILANLLMDALYELMAKLNEFYYKICAKIIKAFTIDLDNLPACSFMISLGWALINALGLLFDQIYALLREILSLIGEFGLAKNLSWEVAANRRHLLGVARILEVLANKLQLASVCERVEVNVNITTDIDNRQANVDEAIFTILQSRYPIIQISPENMQKFFPNLEQKRSELLKFDYGIMSQQNNETNQAKCHDPEQRQRIEALIKNINTALQESFNG